MVEMQDEELMAIVIQDMVEDPALTPDVIAIHGGLWIWVADATSEMLLSRTDMTAAGTDCGVSVLGSQIATQEE